MIEYNNIIESLKEKTQEIPYNYLLSNKINNQWRHYSYADIWQHIIQIASYLRHIGVKERDHVAIYAPNSPEWIIFLYATLLLKARIVPIFTTASPDMVQYILHHGEVRHILVDSDICANILATTPDNVKNCVMLDKALSSYINPTLQQHYWQDMLAVAADIALINEHDAIACITPDEVAALIYSSGTSGTPKAIMLSHRNILANIKGAWPVINQLANFERNKEVSLSFLPLSHVYEFTFTAVFAPYIGMHIYCVEDLSKIIPNLQEVKPTLVTAVPRLYEVMRQKILTEIQGASTFKNYIFNATLQSGINHYNGNNSIMNTIIYHATNYIVRRKIQRHFGGNVKAFISGGAPLNYDVGLFMHAMNLPILQGYGLSEASPIVSVNRPNDNRVDSVGPPLDNVAIHINDDGEILVRADSVMVGYWRDDALTAQTIKDGWLYTGDIGRIDNGHLVISDRKKDIIVTQGGDNISPQYIEGILNNDMLIHQSFIYSANGKYLTVLIVKPPELNMDDALYKQNLYDVIEAVNTKLARYEHIRNFHVIDEPFNTDNNMLTPSLKLKRHAISDRYRDLLTSS